MNRALTFLIYSDKLLMLQKVSHVRHGKLICTAGRAGTNACGDYVRRNLGATVEEAGSSDLLGREYFTNSII